MNRLNAIKIPGTSFAEICQGFEEIFTTVVKIRALTWMIQCAIFCAVIEGEKERVTRLG